MSYFSQFLKLKEMRLIIRQHSCNWSLRFQSCQFRAVWNMILIYNEKSTVILNITYNFLISFVSLDIVKFVSARRNSDSSYFNDSKSDSTSMQPLVVGITVLASIASIIILMILYTYRLGMRQQSRTEQKENV